MSKGRRVGSGLYAVLPMIDTMFIPVPSNRLVATNPICVTNSLDGAIIMHWTFLFSGWMTSSNGSKKASVLPLPVSA